MSSMQAPLEGPSPTHPSIRFCSGSRVGLHVIRLLSEVVLTLAKLKGHWAHLSPPSFPVGLTLSIWGCPFNLRIGFRRHRAGQSIAPPSLFL